jgi:hypothetical protein
MFPIPVCDGCHGPSYEYWLEKQRIKVYNTICIPTHYQHLRKEQRTVDLLGRVHTQWRDMVPMGSAAEDAGYAVSAE